VGGVLGYLCLLALLLVRNGVGLLKLLYRALTLGVCHPKVAHAC
jgi:hypothetical protein